MLLKSFSRIKVKPGSEKELLKKILNIPETLEAHSIMGEFDFLVILGVQEVLSANPWEQLTNVLMEKLRDIPGVLETQTVIPTSSKIKEDHLYEFSKLARGFIYIDTQPGKEAAVMYKLLQFEEVREVHLTPGEHDILAIIEVKKTVLPPKYPDQIQRLVVDRINKIGDVVNTETLIPVSFYYNKSGI